MDIKIPFTYAPVANQIQTLPKRVSGQKGNFKKAAKFESNVKESQMFNLQSCLEPTVIKALFQNLQDEQKQKSLAWSKVALDHLEVIRNGLICGAIPKQTLVSLKNLSVQAKGYIVDDQLKDIMREIETRAKVELAKLEKEDILNKSI